LRDFLLSSGLERSLLLIGEAEAGLLPFFEGAGLLGELLGNLMRESERGGGERERESTFSM
jgi:hypothetical protein